MTEAEHLAAMHPWLRERVAAALADCRAAAEPSEKVAVVDTNLTMSRGHNRAPTAAKLRWCTPRPLFEAAGGRYGGFGLDAAAEPTTALCGSYLSPDRDCLTTPWRDYCRPNLRGERWAWFNPPWGPRRAGFPGTAVFTRRAVHEAENLTGVVVLVPTAPDTSWWRHLFSAASEVRLLPRVAFIDPDTGIAATAPPGTGVTLFELCCQNGSGPVCVRLADENGRASHERA